MIALIQRVRQARVTSEGKKLGQIGQGILCFLGIQKEDDPQKAEKLIKKIAKLRIFADEEGRMNLSIKDLDYELMIVSQFTLAASCKKGTRPSFDQAAPPKLAKELYDYAIEHAKDLSIRVENGKFQADMQVELTNDGPVTFILDA